MDQVCLMCRRTAKAKHHLIFGRGYRELADEDGLYIYLCNECHNIGRVTDRIHENIAAEKLSKMLGQALYERDRCAEGKTANAAREMFFKRYGRSYL